LVVFEHIKNDGKAVREVYRVLKKEGILLFTVPAFQNLYSSHDRALNHYRRYNKRRLESVLRKFKDIETYYWNSFLFLPIAIIRLAKRRSDPQVDTVNIPAWLDSLFYNILIIDSWFIRKGLSMPMGLSIAGYARK